MSYIRALLAMIRGHRLTLAVLECRRCRVVRVVDRRGVCAACRKSFPIMLGKLRLLQYSNCRNEIKQGSK